MIEVRAATLYIRQWVVFHDLMTTNQSSQDLAFDLVLIIMQTSAAFIGVVVTPIMQLKILRVHGLIALTPFFLVLLTHSNHLINSHFAYAKLSYLDPIMHLYC